MNKEEKPKKQKIRVFTAFSGYDSQMMAMYRLCRDYPDLLETELVGWSEIDEPAIASHNAVFPEAADKNYGDISKVDWSQVPDFDLFTYSSPCQDFSISEAVWKVPELEAVCCGNVVVLLRRSVPSTVSWRM